jgi:hypothetical protein
LVWFLVVIIGSLYLITLYSKIDSSVYWPDFNQRLFKILFLVAFVVTLVFSRAPYIVSFLEKGLYLSRVDTGVGGGGWYSYITIFFYPLCIVMAFVDMPRRSYYFYLSLVIVIVVVDLTVLGTRGSPFFVLLFHFLMLRLKFFSLKPMLFFAALFILLIVIIDYQTQGRSADTFTVGWDWVRTIKYSWIFDNLRVDENVISVVDEQSPTLFPLIYLTQYISHSIAEFRVLLFTQEYNLLGHALYLQDQVCLISGCDRLLIQNAIIESNPRAGLYQTLYSSLFFDFGVIGIVVLSSLSLLYFYVARAGIFFLALAVYFAIIIAVSGVENYFYNGLGLARFIVFVALWKLISIKVVFKSIVNTEKVAYIIKTPKASGLV